ncbi:MAG: ATP synthase subunit I [Thiohalocapsa sp.]
MTLALFPTAAAFALAGIVFGLAYFAVLRRSLERYSLGSDPGLIALLAVGRLAAAVAFFGAAATVGAWPTLTAMLGFLAARTLALRAARKFVP